MTESSTMDTGQIKNQKDFRDFLRTLAISGSSNRSLEDYLCALWRLVQQHEKEGLTFSTLAQMLADAFTSPIAPFEDAWLIYKDPPSELTQNHPVENEFEFVKKMLLYQIADLHQMRAEGVLDAPGNILWMGASREGGTTWYNFWPATFLEAAHCGIRPDPNITETGWNTLAILLWLGQIYE